MIKVFGSCKTEVALLPCPPNGRKIGQKLRNKNLKMVPLRVSKYSLKKVQKVESYTKVKNKDLVLTCNFQGCCNMELQYLALCFWLCRLVTGVDETLWLVLIALAAIKTSIKYYESNTMTLSVQPVVLLFVVKAVTTIISITSLLVPVSLPEKQQIAQAGARRALPSCFNQDFTTIAFSTLFSNIFSSES